jgi:hypothetical protein
MASIIKISAIVYRGQLRCFYCPRAPPVVLRFYPKNELEEHILSKENYMLNIYNSATKQIEAVIGETPMRAAKPFDGCRNAKRLPGGIFSCPALEESKISGQAPAFCFLQGHKMVKKKEAIHGN